MTRVAGIAIMLLLFLLQNAVAQEQGRREELVQVIINSINRQNINSIKPYLSNDFQISGRVPPVSLKILEQLVSQLGEKVQEYSWKKTEAESPGMQTYYYSFSYRDLGEREVSFTVNDEGKITTLELVKMKVKTLEEPSKVVKPVDKFIEIPFQVKENLLLVEASVNGEKKTFIFDSGSPRLILNQSHFGEKAADRKTKFSSLGGVHGNINSLDIVKLSSFDFNGIQMKNQNVLVADLSHLESILELPIAGLIGYEVFEDYDLLFNYGTRMLRFMQPDQTQHFVMALSAQLSVSSIPFELKHHIPFFECSVAGQTLSLGLDSGASSNLLSEKWFDVLKSSISNSRETDLSGADGKTDIVKKGELDSLLVADVVFDTIPTIFKDITNLKNAYGIELEGLAGYELLHRQITLVSFSDQKMYFFRTKS